MEGVSIAVFLVLRLESMACDGGGISGATCKFTLSPRSKGQYCLFGK